MSFAEFFATFYFIRERKKSEYLNPLQEIQKFAASGLAVPSYSYKLLSEMLKFVRGGEGGRVSD